MNLIIKNGTIVNASGSFRADIAVRDGVIECIASNIDEEGFEHIVDASGKLVLPGAIDAHTHLAMPFGGTTMVFDFAMQDYGEKMTDTIKRRDAMCAPDAVVDYSFHVAVKDVANGLIDGIEECTKTGIPSFKVFMVYDFGVTDGVFFQVLQKAKEAGALIAVHAENNELVNTLTKERNISGMSAGRKPSGSCFSKPGIRRISGWPMNGMSAPIRCVSSVWKNDRIPVPQTRGKLFCPGKVKAGSFPLQRTSRLFSYR